MLGVGEITVIELKGKAIVELQEIQRLLVDFAERVGRVQNYDSKRIVRHYLMKAFSKMSLKNLLVLVVHVVENFYVIRVSHNDPDAENSFRFITTFEDGISKEREEQEDKGHPVYNITCLHDILYAEKFAEFRSEKKPTDSLFETWDSELKKTAHDFQEEYRKEVTG